MRHRCAHQRHDGVALVARGRHSTLAAPHLDLPTRSGFRAQSRAHPRSVRQARGRAKRLRCDEFVLSTDEKTSIQARVRKHPTSPPRPHCDTRVEHEYARAGAWAYLAALDVHRAKVFGRCEKTTGIDPFSRLVDQVMSQTPYRDARRVFWIMDNGSSHRGQPCVRRLTEAYPNLVPVHGPIHASWLNQIEIYFSIVQRKALTPNDFSCLNEVEDRLLRFQEYYESMATPFDWRFTRNDLAKLTKKFLAQPAPLRLAA